MKESYVKGLANHNDPESCGGARKSDGEALTGASAGRVLSRESSRLGMPTQLRQEEGNNQWAALARHSGIPRGLRPRHARKQLAREPGDPAFFPAGMLGTHREV